MKKIFLFILIALSACCSHRTMTSESKVYTSNSDVALFSAHDSIVASRFDSIISSLEVTIDYLVFNDTVKQKRMSVHAQATQVSTENKQSTKDSTRFVNQSTSASEESTTTKQKKMNFFNIKDIFIGIFIALIIVLYFYYRHK